MIDGPARMQVVASWTGGRADALRQALRMTNESFAEHLGVAVRTVAYWRKRPETVPQPAMQEALDTVLERASDRTKAQFSVLVSEAQERAAASLWHSNGVGLAEPISPDDAARIESTDRKPARLDK